jgi:hypothetical protein
MQLLRLRRRFAAGFTVAIAVVLASFAYISSANAAEMYVLASGTATCQRTGQVAPASFQDESIGLALRQFQDNEQVYISFTFPDGRIFSPTVADGRVFPPNGLDGLVDLPSNFPWLAGVSNGGDYYFTFQVSNRWPYGSYTFSALGATSGRTAQACFVVQPRSGPAPNAGQAVFTAEDNVTGDPSGLHGGTVNLFGRGFRGQEIIDLWITAPDGSVIDYPSQFTSDIGSFAATFVFDERFPVGNYAFTALGRSSGYQVITRFNLASRPSTPSGWAALRVAWRANATAPQTGNFELQGQFFDPFEQVSVWVTLPDGSVRGLPIQQTNQFGEFFAIVALDQRLPTGVYSITAEGLSSRRLVITQVTVAAGTPHNTVTDSGGAPTVIDTNSGLPSTVGDLPVQTGVPSLDPAPEFQPDSQPPPQPTQAPLAPTW